MNRYRYKAKRKDNQEWVYGLLIRKRDLTFNNEYDEFYAIQDDFFEEYRIDEQTLSQCTGLQDIEGNYIFENDIVEYKFSYMEIGTRKGIIKWKNSKYIIEFEEGITYSDLETILHAELIKIIGNRFDEVKE